MPPRNNIIRIFYGSRLVREKGVDILIASILATLEEKDSPYSLHWTIASDGPFRGKILALEKIYPERVVYLGRLTPREMALEFRKADLFFMPSRFLETFGLTALESLASGTPVCGFRKWGLTSFIPLELALDPDEPVASLLEILSKLSTGKPSEPISVSDYSKALWEKKLMQIFPVKKSSILLLHDYLEKIGGAEYYVSDVEKSFTELGYVVCRYGYEGSTTTWKRRWMFVTSIFAFGRGLELRRILENTKPQVIWMHSILRYIWYWWVWEVSRYVRKYPETQVFLSHHDVGLIAPFPQDIMNESQIPTNPTLQKFIFGLSPTRTITASCKWLYISCLRSAFPKNMTHIIFSPFLEKHIQSHFEGAQVIVFPHSYDETIFHP